MKKFICISLCAMLFVGMLAGCRSSVTSEQSLVYVDKKGKVVSIDVESFDESHYKEDDLESFVREEVDNYTKEHGKGTVSLEELKVEDGQAKLSMNYKTTQDYSDFNGIELYQGKIVKALAAGYDFKVDFVKVENGEMGASASIKEIYAIENLKVVIIKANNNVKVPGEICYVSSENVTLTGTDSVSIRGTDDSFETDVYTYIIYK